MGKRSFHHQTQPTQGISSTLGTIGQGKGVVRISRKDITVWTGKTNVGLQGKEFLFLIFFEVTEHHMKKGQQLIFPEIEVDTYWCSLDQLEAKRLSRFTMIMEPANSIIQRSKSDMGLYLLPSCHFASNALVLQVRMLKSTIFYGSFRKPVLRTE